MNTQALNILDVLRSLPAEKRDEIEDFALYLKERYGEETPVDVSDEWNDEDMRDAAIASFRYFEELEKEEVNS